MLSSVLFLSEAREGACWGPTVVLDQTPRSALAQRAWLAPALCNCLVSFPGSLLHGVLPGARASRQPRVFRCPLWLSGSCISCQEREQARYLAELHRVCVPG